MPPDLFEEPRREPILAIAEVEAYVADTAKVASAVESLMRSEGWRLFTAYYDWRKNQIKERRDYTSLEDFHGDRKALDLVDEIIATLESYIDDASRAVDLLTSLVGTENQTPRSSVALSTGEHTEG